MPRLQDEMSVGYEVLVIGAGPAGEATAELGGSVGYSVALVERDRHRLPSTGSERTAS
jgi:flavin-dependent dehydrogenase